MGVRHFTSRREMEEHHFPWPVLIGVPLLLLFLTAYLPKLWPVTSILDLPLLAVIYFALSQRSPIAGTFMGAAAGLLQDALSNQYIGVNGIAKTLIGFAASSVGLKVDVENPLSRTLLVFGFSLAQSGLLFILEHILLGMASGGNRWQHELMRAGANTVIAVPLFLLLDRLRTDDPGL